MNTHLLMALAISLTASASYGASLPRSTPESQGVSSSAILEFVEAANKSIESLHSVMVLRHGQVIAEGWWAPYEAESPHILFSLSKSFTSTAVGLAIAEGRFSIDDEILKFFPDDTPTNTSPNSDNTAWFYPNKTRSSRSLPACETCKRSSIWPGTNCCLR